MPFHIKRNLLIISILFAISLPLFSSERESQEIIDESMIRIEQTMANGQLDIPFLMEPGLLTAEQAQGLKNDLNASIQDNFDFYNKNRPYILQHQGETYEIGTVVLKELKELNQNLLNFSEIFKLYGYRKNAPRAYGQISSSRCHDGGDRARL